jgi:hypothetical protein
MRPYVDDWQYPLSNDSVTVDVEGTLLDALKRVGEELFYDANDIRRYKTTTIQTNSHVYNDVEYQTMHIVFDGGVSITSQIHPSEIFVGGYKHHIHRLTHLFNVKDRSQIDWMDNTVTTYSLLELHEDAFALKRFAEQLHEKDIPPQSPRMYTGDQVIKMMESGLISSAYRWLEPNIRINYEYQSDFKKRVVLPSWTWNARKHIESMTQWERTNHIETELARPDWAIGRYGLN